MLVLGRGNLQQLPHPLLRRAAAPLADFRDQPPAAAEDAACSPDECDDVFWPETDDERERGDRAKESFFTYWDGNESRGLLAFLGAVKDTTQNWHDSTLLSMPGYRDRVIHVGVRPGEGGLNLNMSEKLIRRLGDRGACAGASLIALFAGGEDQTHWDAHRWRRYRVAMAAPRSRG